MTRKIPSSRSKPPLVDPVGFAERLASAMAKADHDQRSLARVVGAHHNIVGNWTKAQYLPRAPHLVGLARALGVSVDWLLTGEGATRSSTGTAASSVAAVQVTQELARLAPSLEQLTRRARRVADKNG